MIYKAQLTKTILILMLGLFTTGFSCQLTINTATAQQKHYKPKSKRLCFKLGKKRYNQSKQPFLSGIFKKKKTYISKKPPVDGEPLTSEKAQAMRQQSSTQPRNVADNHIDSTAKLKEKEAKKSLPATVSDRHARIRKEVEQAIAQQQRHEPLEIEPLYFVTGQEEFAFMDMDPFLKAVEFALQGKMILVEGHTDSLGDAQQNLKLSMRRVDRIKQLMTDIGVAESLISVIGYGESEPLYDNDTEEGRQKNRRVDFKVF